MTKRDTTTTVEIIDADGKGSGPMPLGTFADAVRANRALDGSPPFDLESEEPGKVPDRVISELRTARYVAKDYATAFSDCIKAQAEKYGVKPGALKRYIVALEEDKLEEVDAETDDLARLIGSTE